MSKDAELKEQIDTVPIMDSVNKINALVVDDDRIMRMVVSGNIENMGHNIIPAVNGLEAMDILRSDQKIDIILLDREMPEMNGMEVVSAMKSNPSLVNIPIIMATGSDGAEQIKEGIDAGVFYYLTKPIDENILRSVVSAAVRYVRQRATLRFELGKHRASFGLINICSFEIKTIEDAENLSAFLANCYPNPDRVISGLAALIINAVEHGNLGMTYDDKTSLINDGKWREEMARRANLPEYRGKKVKIVFKRNDDGLYLRVEDEGNGFEWHKYMHIDPSRATDNHGRGIAQANAVCFDEINYNETGNKVIAIIRYEDELKW